MTRRAACSRRLLRIKHMAKRSTRKKMQTRLLLLLAIVVLAVLCVLIAEQMQDAPQPAAADTARPQLSVMAIDVGQADSLLVMLSTGEVMLIDAGEASNTGAIFEELDERGITDIDVLVATHPHAD